MVRDLGLRADSNPVLTSGEDLFPVIPDSTPRAIVNRFLIWFLIMFLLSWKIVSFRLLKKVECLLTCLIATCTSTINKAFPFPFATN